MSRELRAVVFGNGFARKVMLPCLRHVPEIRVVGIASPNRERAQETARAFSIEHVFSDHRDLLDAAQPDLAVIATPPHRHLDQTLDALASGCHILCEKPTALSAAESLEMLEAARKHPDRLTVLDHELRFDPRRLLARKWMREGKLGRILHATYSVHSPGLRDASAPWRWWFDAKAGGGTLGALGSHAVDSLRALLGEVAEVRGHLHTFHPDRPDPETGVPREVTVDEFAAAWLRFESGAIAQISLSLVEAERIHRITVAGEQGFLRIDEQAPMLAAFGKEELAEVPVDEDLPSNHDLGIPDTDWARNFLRFSKEIAGALTGAGGQGATARPRLDTAADFVDAHRNQLVLDAIRTSHEQARWVPVEKVEHA